MCWYCIDGKPVQGPAVEGPNVRARKCYATREDALKDCPVKMCWVCIDKTVSQMPEADAAAHYEEYVEFTKAVRRDGHFIGANRLAPA